MTSPRIGTISDEFSPELVPVVEPGTLALAFPQPAVAGNEFALGDLLSDALFGEVIDISDLIPRVLSPPAEAGSLAVRRTLSEPGSADRMPARSRRGQPSGADNSLRRRHTGFGRHYSVS